MRAFLLSQLWALAISSAGFLTLIIWSGSSAGWDPWASIGQGLRHLPLWLLLLLGVLLFASGVVIGTVQQFRLLRRNRPADTVLSPEAVRLHRDGPGWLSLKAETEIHDEAPPLPRPADQGRPTCKVHPVADDRELQATYGESMSQKNIALSIMKSPWSQAVAGGALTLIPGRKYPTWLRQTITWGTTTTTAVLIAFPGLSSKVFERASVQQAPETTEISPRARAGFATAAGALMYGTMRFGWWFDEAAEQAMRRKHVPFPRVVLGIAVGALYYYTIDREQKATAAS